MLLSSDTWVDHRCCDDDGKDILSDDRSCSTHLSVYSTHEDSFSHDSAYLMDQLCNQKMLSELIQGLWISIKLKVLHISLKETTIIWLTTLVRSALSFTTTKRWEFDHFDSTSRENTSTVFDDTLSTKVDNCDTFPTKLVTATLYRKIEKAVHHGWAASS
jgi:hypothetical protein